MNRRNFVKASVAAGGALLAPAPMPGLAMMRHPRPRREAGVEEAMGYELEKFSKIVTNAEDLPILVCFELPYLCKVKRESCKRKN